MDHHPTIKSTKFDRNDNQGFLNTIRVYEELFSTTPPYQWWPRCVHTPSNPVNRAMLRRDVLSRKISFLDENAYHEEGEDDATEQESETVEKEHDLFSNILRFCFPPKLRAARDQQ